MTSSSLEDLTRPVARSTITHLSRPPSRIAFQSHTQTPRSVPSHLVIDLTDGTTLFRDSTEPSFKRQKLDTGAGSQISNASNRRFAGAPNLSAEQAAWKDVAESPSSLEATEQNASNSSSEQEHRSGSNRAMAPFPNRPDASSSLGIASRLSAGKSATRGEVQVKPYVLDIPSIAPRYQGDGPTDFFPWSGGHAEDALNEAVTKQGFYDKLQISQNESNTARPSVWSSLKHKSGLQVLSSLLVSTLNRRQAHGTVTSNCTFKPPPRVTLTDTKREIWLRDLANSAIPLRRLSRTIPHGIRGKSLLDQCMAKNIGTDRAIWLAKCVGANEIRAFKRKGSSGAFAAGGEAKWIKDWTINVEQFVEGIISRCGTTEWKSQITYGLRLASHLYTGGLLDQDHYLDWVVSSIQSSDLDNIPIWLLIMQTLWKDIVAFQRRGRRLAEALLDVLGRSVAQKATGAYAQVIDQLSNITRTFLKSHPACFILPGSWSRYETVLKHSIQSRKEDAITNRLLDRLSRRNAEFSVTTNGEYLRKLRSPRQRLIALLDGADCVDDFSRLSSSCLAIAMDRSSLVITTAEWATTLFRTGDHRLYLAVRLLRKWRKFGITIQEPLMAFLNTEGTPMGISKTQVYRLNAELVRSKTFSVGNYLQWLIARGALTGHHIQDPNCPCHIGLLSELPLHALSDHVVNLRSILLSSVGGSAADETAVISGTKLKITERMHDLHFQTHILLSDFSQDLGLQQTSQTVRSEIARWIRGMLASHEGPEEDAALKDSYFVVTTCDQFNFIRRILEDLEDYSMLADILCVLCEDANLAVLTSVSDTLNYYFDIFATIGATEELSRNTILCYEHLRSQKICQRSLLVSLVDLAERSPTMSKQTRRLRKELLLLDQKNAVLACSPISDHMAEALQSIETNFVDEVEQVLASGTSMDKQTLNHLFTTITKRLEHSWTDPGQRPNQLVELLTRLRSFDTKSFDLLADEWLRKMLARSKRPALIEIVPTLVCAGFVTLDSVLDVAASLTSNTADPLIPHTLAVEALKFLVIDKFGNSITFMTADSHSRDDHLGTHRSMQYLYRFHVQQQQLLREPSSSITSLLRTAVALAARPGPAQASAEAFIASVDFSKVLKDIYSSNSECLGDLNQALEAGLSIEGVQRAIDAVMYHDHPFAPQSDLLSQVATVLDVANEFNLPLCRLKLNTLLNMPVESSKSVLDAVIAALLDASTLSEEPRLCLWTQVVSGCRPLHGQEICERVEREIFMFLSNTASKVNNINAAPDQNASAIPGLLSVVRATASSISDDISTILISQVLELLSVLLLSPTWRLRDRAQESKNIGEKQLEQACHTIRTLLELLVIHQSTLQKPQFAQDTLSQLLVTLSNLLIHPLLACHPITANHIFDVLVLLTDFITDDTRTRCIRALRDQYRSHDPRLLFLFGYPKSLESEWLQLVSDPIPASTSKQTTENLDTSRARQPFTLRKWEIMQDATPLMGENDTSLSLSLFGARKVIR